MLDIMLDLIFGLVLCLLRDPFIGAGSSCQEGSAGQVCAASCCSIPIASRCVGSSPMLLSFQALATSRNRVCGVPRR